MTSQIIRMMFDVAIYIIYTKVKKKQLLPWLVIHLPGTKLIIIIMFQQFKYALYNNIQYSVF